MISEHVLEIGSRHRTNTPLSTLYALRNYDVGDIKEKWNLWLDIFWNNRLSLLLLFIFIYILYLAYINSRTFECYIYIYMLRNWKIIGKLLEKFDWWTKLKFQEKELEFYIGAPIFLVSRKWRETTRNRRGNSRNNWNTMCFLFRKPFHQPTLAIRKILHDPLSYRIVSRSKRWLNNFRFDQFTRGQFRLNLKRPILSLYRRD